MLVLSYGSFVTPERGLCRLVKKFPFRDDKRLGPKHTYCRFSGKACLKGFRGEQGVNFPETLKIVGQSGGFFEIHHIFAGFFAPEQPYAPRFIGVDGKAAVIGLYGQLPTKTAVHERQKFYFFGAAQVEQRIHCGANRAPGKQYIVYQNHRFTFNGEGKMRFGRQAQRRTLMEVVAVKGGVECSVGKGFISGNFFQDAHQSVGYGYAARLNANEHRVFKLPVRFYKLMRQTVQNNAKLVGIEQDFHGEGKSKALRALE